MPERNLPMLPKAYAWLANEPGPKMLVAALALYGTLETPGAADNPVIIAWADEVAKLFPTPYNNWAADFYNDDSIPHCGLGMAIAAARAGRKPPDKYLSALAWKAFGVPVDRPMLGDIMIKPRFSGGKQVGGHVTMYVGEDATHYHGLGSNQSDAYNIARFKKTDRWAFRRPAYINQPTNVRVVKVAAGGAPKSVREA